VIRLEVGGGALDVFESLWGVWAAGEARLLIIQLILSVILTIPKLHEAEDDRASSASGS
jgi:hypothetical protein